jgi:hypothetical protein
MSRPAHSLPARALGRRAALGLTVAITTAIAIGACGGASGAGVAAGQPGLCPPPDVEMPGAVDVAARCKHVIAVADERLGLLHWPVSEVQVRWTLCPPGARCRFLQLRQAWVIYRFWAGDPVMIHVGPPQEGVDLTDDLVADAPEPLPAWLAEELAVEEDSGPS